MWEEEKKEGTQGKIILLWDQLKKKLRKSEEDEMQRLIGTELIDKVEELRMQYENMLDIVNEMESESQNRDQSQRNQSSLFEQKNNEFLNKEISFFLDNLRKKAVEGGLGEEQLMPIQDVRDKQIYDYIKKGDRPQSAISQSTRPGSSIAKPSTERSMHSSFYQSSEKKKQQDQGASVVDSFKMSNVLELSEQEHKVLNSIKTIIQDECQQIQDELQDLQQQLIDQSKEQSQESRPPTAQELKDFSNKLKDEYLRSDSILKATGTPLNRKKSLPRVQGSQNQSFNLGQSVLPPMHVKGKISLANQINPNMGSELKQNPKIIPSKGPIKVHKIKKAEQDNDDQMMNFTQTSFGSNYTSQQKNQGKISWTKIRTISQQKTQVEPQNVIPDAKIQGKGVQIVKAKTLKMKNVKKIEENKTDQLYGFDIDFLKEMDLGDMIEEAKPQNQDNLPKEFTNANYENKTIDQLREEFDLKQPHVKKFRGLCQKYRELQSDQSVSSNESSSLK